MSGRSDDQLLAVPHWFLIETAPKIREIAELQVMLAIFRLTAERGTIEEPVSERDLLTDELLVQALRLEGASRSPDDAVHRGIELAVARDSLLKFTIEAAEASTGPEAFLLVATQGNRSRLERYRSGALPPPQSSGIGSGPGRVQSARPGVFSRYEQNIGLVTPIIADRLVEALELYPESWIDDAIEAAVSYNRRNWRYIQRILETWATEGRSNEANRRHQPNTGDFDPERHLSGEYASIFRRRRRE